MTIKSTLFALAATTAIFAIGCGNKAASTDADGGAAAPGSSAAAAAGGVTTYPTQVVQGGTVRLVDGFTVHSAADQNSPVLTRLGVGTLINLKASYSNWMMIEYPSAVATMSPGWIQLRDATDPRVTSNVAAPAPTPTVVAPVVTAAVTPVAPGHAVIKPRGVK